MTFIKARKNPTIAIASIVLVIATVAISIGIMTNNATADPGSSAANPAPIVDCTDLFGIATNISWIYYQLSNDIDCENVSHQPIGYSSSGDFTGHLDGNGYTISNLNISYSPDDYRGLFAKINGGVVRNLGITDSSISGKNYVGALAGSVGNATISDVRISNTSVTGSDGQIGGFAGANFNATVLRSSVKGGTVTGSTNQIGGFYGYASGNTSDSFANTTVSGGASGDQVGGFVGFTDQTFILNDSYSAGSVTGDNTVGGVVGWFWGELDGGTMNQVFTDSTVNGNGTVGGVIGDLSGSTANFDQVAWDIPSTTQSDCSAGGAVDDCFYVNNGGIAHDFWYGTAGAIQSPISFWTNLDAGNDNWVIQDGELPVLTALGRSINEPSAPGDVTLTLVDPTFSSVHAVWSVPANNGSAITKYTVKISDQNGFEEEHDTTDVSYDFTGLEASTTYYVQVKAVNAIGEGEYSGQPSVTTDATPEPDYEIDSCQDLQEMKYDLEGDYTLDRNIDCSQTNPFDEDFDEDGTWGDGKGFEPVGTEAHPFGGTLTYAGEENETVTISGLTVYRGTETNLGLFGFTDNASIEGAQDPEGNNLLVFSDLLVAGSENLGGIVGQATNQTHISNVTLNDPQVFGYLSQTAHTVGAIAGSLDNGFIENVKIVNPFIGGKQRLGGVVGYLNDADVVSCTVENITMTLGNVDQTNGPDAQKGGGVVGEIENGTIEACEVSGSVRGYSNIGGVVGIATDATVRDSTSDVVLAGINNPDVSNQFLGGVVGFASSTVLSGLAFTGSLTVNSPNSSENIGGIVGYIENSSEIFESYSDAEIQGNIGVGHGLNVGGIAGYANETNIHDVYSLSNVTGYGQLGGLVGAAISNAEGISNSYSTGNVSGTLVIGGLVGVLNISPITNSFYLGQVTGATNSTGLVAGTREGSEELTNIFVEEENDGQRCIGDDPGNDCYSPIAYGALENSTTAGPYSQWNFDTIWFAHPDDLPTFELGDVHISDCEELQAMSQHLDGTYILDNDIDCSMTNPADGDYDTNGTWGDEKGFIPVGDDGDPFTGTIKSEGEVSFTISGLYIDRPLEINVGVIGYGDGATLSQFNILGSYIRGQENVGAFAGTILNGNIDSIATFVGTHVEGEVNVGALFGTFYESEMTDGLAMSSEVSGGQRIGGLVGFELNFSSINGSEVVETQVMATGETSTLVGGAIGFMTNSQINDLLVSESTVEGNGLVGGAVGNMQGAGMDQSVASGITIDDVTVTGSYADANQIGGVAGAVFNSTIEHAEVDDETVVQGNAEELNVRYIGGIAGYVYSAYINYSYSKASVFGNVGAEGTGENVGGFVGFSLDAIVNDSYASGEVVGDIAVGGFIGFSEELQVQRSYSTGDVTGENYVGGFLGRSFGMQYGPVGGVIAHSFSTSKVNAPDDATQGGFVGTQLTGREIEFTNNYFDVTRTGTSGAVDGGGMNGIDAVNADGSDDEFFFNNTSGVLFGNWDFAGDPWYEHAKTYPTFEAVDNSDDTIQDGEDTTTTTSPGNSGTQDTDNDGIDDATENAGPNDGDANGDGAKDAVQSNVLNIIHPVTGKPYVLEVSDTCVILHIGMGNQSDFDTKDGDYKYPLGVAGFTLQCETPGQSVTITQYHYVDFEAKNFSMRKYIPTTKTYLALDGASVTDVKIGGAHAVKGVYTLVDDGPLDLDKNGDGIVNDPSGFATLNTGLLPATGSNSLATLWIALALVLIGAASFKAARTRSSQSS